MWFKISSRLLILLPLLINSQPTHTDSNPKHLEKRSLIEAFSSNPKFISVFQNPDPSKTLIQKFMGDNYNREYATTNNAQYTFYYPAGTRYSQENYNDDEEIVPDCVHRIIKPIIRDTEQKKIETHKHSKHPVPTIKPISNAYVPGTFLEINREFEKNKKEANNDFVQIPKYVYTPPNQHINKYQEKSIPIHNQEVPQVHENVNEGRRDLFKLKENKKIPDVSEYPDRDQLQIQLTKIFPPPSGKNYDNGEESYTIENVKNFKDFEELFNHSKMMPLMRPMGLANNPDDKKIKISHFLNDPDPRNPPAPLEQQPNLLLISDWLEMSKKLYDTLLPEEKRRAYDLNQAIVSRRKYKGNNLNNMSPEVALKLLKDEYLVADSNDNKKYNKQKYTTVGFNEDNTRNNGNNIHTMHKNVHFIGPKSDPDIFDVINTINNRYESETENDTLLLKKNKDDTLTLINVLPTNNTKKHNNTNTPDGKNANEKKTPPKPINNRKTVGNNKIPELITGSNKHKITNINRVKTNNSRDNFDINSIFVRPAQHILNNNGKHTNNKKIVTTTVTDNKSTKPSFNKNVNFIAPKLDQNLIDIIKSINNRYGSENKNDTKKHDNKIKNNSKPLTYGVIKNTTHNDNHLNSKSPTIKKIITTETGPGGKMIMKNVTINQYNENKTASNPIDNKKSVGNEDQNKLIESEQLPGSNKKIVTTTVTDNKSTKPSTNNDKNIQNNVNFIVPKSERNITDILNTINNRYEPQNENNNKNETKKHDNKVGDDTKPLTYKTVKNFITTEIGPNGKLIRKNVTETTIHEYNENKTAAKPIEDNNKLMSKNVTKTNKKIVTTDKSTNPTTSTNNNFRDNLLNTLLSLRPKPSKTELNNNNNNVISARSAVDPIPSVSEITNILSGIFQEFSQPAVKERGHIK